MEAATKTFRDIFNYSSDLIYIQDENGVFLDVNQTVLDAYGYKKEEILGKSPGFLGVPGKNDIRKVSSIIKLVWEKGNPQHFEWWALRKDGSEFLKDVMIRKGLYFDRSVLISTARDITERKEAEEELKARNQELKKLNAALDAFVYSASHDLKAPLSSIQGLLDLMKRDDPANAGEYIRRIDQSLNKLNQFIYDLVDYSRNAKMDVKAEKIRVNESIYQLINELKYAGEAGMITFDLQLNTPVEIYTDSFRLRLILSNLISNSIRYHDRNKDKSYIMLKSAVRENSLLLEIIDNGIGIAPEHHDKVFKMFYRASERNQKGSGLGLFLVREAVDLLKGEIKLTSSPGVGTKVIVQIPVHSEEKVIETV